MPSDPRTPTALAALTAQRQAFRSAVATAADEIAARLRAYRSAGDGQAERASLELGVFASGRIDPERFAALLETSRPLDPAALERMERALAAMREVAGAGDDLHLLRLPPGGDLRGQVGRALARAGLAFAAAREAELLHQGRSPAPGLEAWPEGFPFTHWNRAERQIAPPLVVEVEGGDLQVGGLADLLTGRQKIVLLVREPAPPAALVRLVTPGVFVMQGSDAAELGELAAVDGPAVAALLPAGAASFVHRPGEAELGGRLEVRSVPEQPRASIGGVSLFQQAEELRQLATLARAALAAVEVAAAEPGAAQPAADPAGRLAAWLLQQAQVDGAAGEG
jgi:hypothetical protein